MTTSADVPLTSARQVEIFGDASYLQFDVGSGADLNGATGVDCIDRQLNFRIGRSATAADENVIGGRCGRASGEAGGERGTPGCA